MTEELKSKFKENYGFTTDNELFSLNYRDIMENILAVSEQLTNLDTSDIDKAIVLVGYLEEWKALYLYTKG